MFFRYYVQRVNSACSYMKLPTKHYRDNLYENDDALVDVEFDDIVDATILQKSNLEALKIFYARGIIHFL